LELKCHYYLEIIIRIHNSEVLSPY